MNPAYITSVTQQTRPVLQFHLRLNQNFNYSVAIDCLTQMIADHPDWMDPTSLRLKKWAHKTILSYRLNPQDLTALNARLQKLLGSILQNPMSGYPLNDPVLERSWIWEKTALEEFTHLFKCLFPQQVPQSPIDNGQLENPHPHLFAKAILAWANRFPFSTEQLTPENFSNPTFSSSSPLQDSQTRLFKYIEEGQKYQRALISKETYRMTAIKTEELKLKEQKRKETILAQLEAITKRTHAETQALKDAIALLQKTTQAEIDQAHAQIATANEKMHLAQEELVKEIKINQEHLAKLQAIQHYQGFLNLNINILRLFLGIRHI